MIALVLIFGGALLWMMLCLWASERALLRKVNEDFKRNQPKPGSLVGVLKK